MAVKLVSLAKAAEHIGKSERQVRNYIGEGYFRAYKRPNDRRWFVDLVEVDAWLASNPRGLHGRTPFGPKAQIVQLPAIARNVEPR